MGRRIRRVFKKGILFCFSLTLLMFLNSSLTNEYDSEPELRSVNETCDLKKVLYNQTVAMEYTKERMEQKTFDCKPIPGGAKLYEIEYDLHVKHTLIRMNIDVIQTYFNSSDSIECSVTKFDKNEYASEAYSVFSTNLLFHREVATLSSSNKHQVTISEHGFYYLKCCEKEARDLTLFDDVITILPRQMSKLPVPKIRTQAESFAYDENPLYSDQNLYEPCEIPEDERKPMKMNILIIQIDSVSNNHFKRMFPDTLEFLSRSLPNNVIFENFMVVGENTVPNSFPWIGGVIPNGIKELKISKEQSIYSYDFSNRFPLIWKDFQKLGHITSYNEDYLINALFQLGGSGFKQTTTNFYNFPYWEKFRSLKMQSPFCLNGQLASDIYCDQINQFVTAMNLDENKEMSFFAVNLFSLMSHNYFEIARAFDIRLKKQLEEFSIKGYLNQTLLIILSDHGGRPYAYGEKAMNNFGNKEFANPILSIKLPDSMRNTSYYENLVNNRDNMVTSFDIHKTLKHFYFLTKNGLNESSPTCQSLMRKSEARVRGLRGLSLFESLPAYRSCSEALIPLDHCECFAKKEIDQDTFEIETRMSVKEMALFLYSEVVRETEALRKKCQLYQFHKVLNVKSFVYGNKKVYEVKIALQPGPSHFRAIVSVVDSKWYHLLYSFLTSLRLVPKRFELAGQIIRDNKYGDQPKCLENLEQTASPFCYCFHQ